MKDCVQLTQGQQRLLQLAANGLSDQQIAEELGKPKGGLNGSWGRLQRKFGVTRGKGRRRRCLKKAALLGLIELPVPLPAPHVRPHAQA